MIQPPTRQIPGVYHRRIGDIVVTAGVQTLHPGQRVRLLRGAL